MRRKKQGVRKEANRAPALPVPTSAATKIFWPQINADEG
jgi:hypothetical protein